MRNKGFSKSIGDNSSINSNSVVKEGGGSHAGKKRIDPQGGASAPMPTWKLPDVMPGEKSGGRTR